MASDMSDAVRQNAPEPSDVQSNVRATEKVLGGITGKGWLPGQSGNPGGSSKGRRYCTAFNRGLAEGDLDTTVAVVREILNDRKTLRKLILNGGVQFLNHLRDTLDGPLRQAVELSGPDGGPIDLVSRMLENKRRRDAESE